MTSQVQVLQREVERLQDQVTVFEIALGREIKSPRILNLSRMQERVFCAIYHRGFCTRDAIMAAMYGHEIFDKDPKIIDVVICKLRLRLKPHSITIANVWGRGYEIPEECRLRIKAMIDDEARRAA